MSTTCCSRPSRASAAIARELLRARARPAADLARTATSTRRILADDAPFPDPARLIIVPDHYLTRMLLSQGIPPGAARRAHAATAARVRDRRPGDLAAASPTNWHLFRGTPSRLWLERPSATVFGVDHPAARRRPPTRSTTRSPPGWPSRTSGPGRCSSGSTSRCWPPPSRRWTTWPRTPSWPPTAGAGRAAG